VADTGELLVALGYDDVEGNKDGALWVSRDGLSWSRLEEESVFRGTGDEEVSRVVAPERVPDGAPPIIAAGSFGSDAAIWYSEDGQTWVRDPDPDEAFGGAGRQSITSIGARGSPVLVVGADGDDAAIWSGIPG
jgi:hypothetical protein